MPSIRRIRVELQSSRARRHRAAENVISSWRAPFATESRNHDCGVLPLADRRWNSQRPTG